MEKYRFWVLVIVSALVLSGVANADTCTATLGPNGECVSEAVNGSTVTLTIDTTNLTISANFLDAAAIGLNGNGTATLTGVTRNGTDVSANWTGMTGGISNGGGAGCDGTGSFWCAQAKDPDGAFSAVGGVFVFTFQLGAGSTANFDVKDIFVNSSDTKVGAIMSQGVGGPGAPVPEPGTLVMLGTGLFTLGGFFRRKIGL